MLPELKTEINKLSEKFKTLKQMVGFDELEKKKNSLEEKASGSSLWDDPASAKKLLQELDQAKKQHSELLAIQNGLEESEVFLDIATKEKDSSSLASLKDDILKLRTQIDRIELSTLLSGEHDKENAILSINAGAGGTDAQDWAQILMRMYLRWAEEKGYETEVADLSYGEQAGIKNTVIFVRAPYAFGYLRSESGVHRLVRMSPFNADGKRHTSFAAVEVIPETGEDITVEIKPEDLRIDTFRSSGPGGQNVNKTSSAIRITHLPTGIITQSQASPSQHRNKELAMTLLASRLKERLEKEQKQKIEDLKGEQKQIAWGSQIRSYVFAPYQLVKDHRTGSETGNVEKVIDGQIDQFIEAYLKAQH
ncbi:MAG: peptide chain release factor 2 [Candidatus Margulisiibacteriota bacterium]